MHNCCAQYTSRRLDRFFVPTATGRSKLSLQNQTHGRCACQGRLAGPPGWVLRRGLPGRNRLLGIPRLPADVLFPPKHVQIAAKAPRKWKNKGKYKRPPIAPCGVRT